jgi:4-hydroxy-4-methyl-2-oxoglutarate aldolase
MAEQGADGRVADLVRRLGAVDSTSLADAGPSLRVLPPGLAPVRPGSKAVGTVVPVDSRDDLVPVLVGLRSAGPGDVLVVTGSPGRALAGELFATEARRRGLAGIVIDGLCRDSRTLRAIDLPFFARGTSPRAYGATKLPVEDAPIVAGGADAVDVRPGDLVLADDDGVVLGSVDEVAAAIDGAEEIQRREEALRAAIEGGESIFDHLNLDEHLAALSGGADSRLRFS